MSRRNSDEPSSFEPGLEHLITALTARGHPQELAGRDSALTAFRAASQPSAPSGAEARQAAHHRSAKSQARSRQRRFPGLLNPVRLAAAAAAGIAVLFAGVTAAAYAQALPAPVQQLAHSVLAPLGVPNSQPEARSSGSSGSALPPSATTPAAAGTDGKQPSTGAAQRTASCPCPATSTTTTANEKVAYTATLNAATAWVRPGALDLFTGKVSAHGKPAKGARVRLFERAAGAGGWHLAATGRTGPGGGFKLRVRVAASAAFELAVPNGGRSAPVRVAVSAPVKLRLSVGHPADQLIVTAPAGSSGETVWLTELVRGQWDNVTSLPLGAGLRASFAVPARMAAGHYYRAELVAAGTRPQTLSNTLWVPRTHRQTHRHTGAKAIGGPTHGPSPTPSATGSPTASPTPAGPAPTEPTGTPTPTSPSPAPPAQPPVPPTPAPTGPGPA